MTNCANELEKQERFLVGLTMNLEARVLEREFAERESTDLLVLVLILVALSISPLCELKRC